MDYTIKMVWDDEAYVWIATSDEIPGLALESGSLDALIERVRYAAPELVEMNHFSKINKLHFMAERDLEAYA